MKLKTIPVRFPDPILGGTKQVTVTRGSKTSRRSGPVATHILVALLAIGAVTQLSLAAERISRVEEKVFMRTKLAWANAALEGLTLEKFDVVSQNAIRMRNMTHSNLWFVIRQPDYLRQTTNFQQSVERLSMAAIDKNLEASTEAYVKVVGNCIECHRLLRVDQRKAAPSPGTDKPGRERGQP